MSPLRARTAALALIALRVLLDGWRLLADPVRATNHEESFNAGVAWLIAKHGLIDQLLALQYKAFCGGCTVVSLLAMPLPSTWLAWKSLALAWTAATLAVTGWAVQARFGTPAALGALALLAVPPPGLSALDGTLWGNHRESALWVMAAMGLLARDRAVAAAFVSTLAIWFARTAAYAWPVVLWQAWRGGSRRRVVGAVLAGLAPLALPAARGDHGYYRMTAWLPEGLAGVVRRLTQLVDPVVLGSALTPGWSLAPGWAMVWLAAALGAAWWLRRSVWVLLPMGFAAATALSGFAVPRVDGDAPLVNLRYHAPWLFWGTLLPGVAAGQAYARWPRVAVALGGGLLLGNATAQWRSLGPPSPLARTIAVVEPVRLSTTLAGRVSPQRLARTDSWLAARARGIQLGLSEGPDGLTEAAAIGDAALWGLGQALVTRETTPAQARAWLALSPPEHRRALALGMALELGFTLGERAPRGTPREQISEALATLRGEDCALCAAAGQVAAIRCGAFADDLAPGPCLAEALADEPAADEVLFGFGLAWSRPTRSPARTRALLADLAHAGVDETALREGLAHPLAGADGAVEAGLYRTVRAPWLPEPTGPRRTVE